MLEQDGKKDEALVKYKELTEKYPSSPYLEEAKTKLGEKKEG
jgi:outer membrane protein assembly factor BamD (BamD/ComL family)